MELDEQELEATKKNREKKCKFCQELKVKQKRYFDIRIVDGNFLGVGNECSEGCGYDWEVYKINYCPMCGRKLN